MPRVQVSLAPDNTVLTNEVTESPFLPDAELWNKINLYVYHGAMLPTNMPSDIEKVYAKVREHSTRWRDVTFPKALTVADNVVDFGNKAVPLYEEVEIRTAAMMKAADGSREYTTARQAVVRVLNRMITDAARHATNATTVKGTVEAFGVDTKADHARVKELKTTYDAKWGSGSKDDTELLKKINDLQNEIASLRDDYNHYVVVASTTPTYAWIYPWGTIPAAVVAGVYADRAIKALKKIDEQTAQLALKKEQRRQQLETLAALRLQVDSIKGIEVLMDPAVQALQKIANSWTATARNLEKLRDEIGALKSGYDLYFVDLQQAKDDWQRLADKADAYRVNAFIRFTAQAA